jgi:DNA invertase Pin-like site-specific DNA recombinase
MHPNPWDRLGHDWPEVPCRAADLGMTWGLTRWVAGRPVEIVLNSRLTQVQRRVTVAHECEHLDRGAPCASLQASIEQRVLRATARYLIPDLGVLGRHLAVYDMHRVRPGRGTPASSGRLHPRVHRARRHGQPELQLTAITDHCARSGYVLVDVVEDLDLTARFWRRRQAERVVGMIESGDADVIVLWKWSRLARNRRDWAVALDRVEVAGGKLDSATEPIDATTSSGRLARGMLAEFAAFESDRIGDVWKEVHARRTKQGLPANGKPRFGYRVVDGVHRPGPGDSARSWPTCTAATSPASRCYSSRSG